VTLAEIVTGCPVTAEELARPDVRRLSSLAAYEMAWCNDITPRRGRQRSTTGGEFCFPFLRSSGALDARQAMNEAVRLHDQTMSSFMSLEQAVAGDASTRYCIICAFFETGFAALRLVSRNLRYSVRAIDTVSAGSSTVTAKCDQFSDRRRA